MAIDLDLERNFRPALRCDLTIGAVGAGFIMRDVQLVAYRNAGYNVTAITSRTPEIAREVADLRGIPRVYETVEQMLDAESIDILDIAVPPDYQLELIRKIAAGKHIPKGILAQKPLATNYRDAQTAVRLCQDRGIRLAVNQNMRYDQSIRALRTLLRRNYLGEPVLATIEMRAIPHWQKWLRDYGRLTLLNMSVHHLDCFRHLFGEPGGVFVSARKDPRIPFAHQDGICLYILEYDNGFRASAWDDTWVGPVTACDQSEPYIKWRVEGTGGVAEGGVGWPAYPNRQPSTIRFATSENPGMWFCPGWREVWFPDAFAGPMADLINAIAEEREPENSGSENLHTMALVDACYLSLAEKRVVRVDEVLEERAH